jgi:hypothetical protein
LLLLPLLLLLPPLLLLLPLSLMLLSYPRLHSSIHAHVYYLLTPSTRAQ